MISKVSHKFQRIESLFRVQFPAACGVELADFTGLAESGEAGDETIRNLAGLVSRQMMKHYSHIGMEAKRRAVESLISRKVVGVAATTKTQSPKTEMPTMIESFAKESTKVALLN